jgi:hypothetical protein
VSDSQNPRMLEAGLEVEPTGGQSFRYIAEVRQASEIEHKVGSLRHPL